MLQNVRLLKLTYCAVKSCTDIATVSEIIDVDPSIVSQQKIQAAKVAAKFAHQQNLDTEPLSAEEKASPDFKINEYCPYCIKRD